MRRFQRSTLKRGPACFAIWNLSRASPWSSGDHAAVRPGGAQRRGEGRTLPPRSAATGWFTMVESRGRTFPERITKAGKLDAVFRRRRRFPRRPVLTIAPVQSQGGRYRRRALGQAGFIGISRGLALPFFGGSPRMPPLAGDCTSRRRGTGRSRARNGSAGLRLALLFKENADGSLAERIESRAERGWSRGWNGMPPGTGRGGDARLGRAGRHKAKQGGGGHGALVY